MTPTRILLASAAMVSLLIMFATRPVSAPPEPVVRAIQTEAILQLAFDTPSWVPDEATKKKALLRAYELNGNSMVGDNTIDLSQEDLTGRVTADAPAHAAVEVVDPNARNVLDAQADMLVKGNEPQPKADVCKRHGLHKVIYGDRWRCRK